MRTVASEQRRLALVAAYHLQGHLMGAGRILHWWNRHNSLIDHYLALKSRLRSTYHPGMPTIAQKPAHIYLQMIRVVTAHHTTNYCYNSYFFEIYI
jgi:hypothetical protein